MGGIRPYFLSGMITISKINRGEMVRGNNHLHIENNQFLVDISLNLLQRRYVALRPFKINVQTTILIISEN